MRLLREPAVVRCTVTGLPAVISALRNNQLCWLCQHTTALRTSPGISYIHSSYLPALSPCPFGLRHSPCLQTSIPTGPGGTHLCLHSFQIAHVELRVLCLFLCPRRVSAVRESELQSFLLDNVTEHLVVQSRETHTTPSQSTSMERLCLHCACRVLEACCRSDHSRRPSG